MEIDWGKNMTKEDYEVISAIVKRATMDNIGFASKDAFGLNMDIEAAHHDTPLDLKKLLAFDHADFVHDIYGIHIHLDRYSGKLEHCFLPRSAKRDTDEPTKPVDNPNFSPHIYR